MQHQNPSNEYLQPVDLDALAKLRSDAGPVFSLYLELPRRPRGTASALERFENLLREAAETKAAERTDLAYRGEWDAEAARIRRLLQEDSQPKAQGLAVFGCQAAGLWKVIPLPIPVRDQLTVKVHPFVRPLEVVMREFPCTLVVLADQGTARMVTIFLGGTAEITHSEVVPVTGGAWQGATREMIQSLVEQAEIIWKKENCECLLIGGSEEALAVLRETLPETLSRYQIGELRASPQDGLEEILTEARALKAESEYDLEKQRLEELLSLAREGGGVLGLEQTLLAVRGKKAHLLVVEEGFALPGGECPNCGFLGEGKEGVCLICGVALRPEPDIVEAALKRVLDQGGDVEILRSREWCKALAAQGHIGALVHADMTPIVKDATSRRIISEGGKINRDVLHDEAMEESFPASDPPAF